MKSGSSAVSWVVVLMAASSLLAMIGMLKVDQIVNHTLYNYGLQFSYAWAIPYWNTIDFVFALGWLNIIAAVAVQSYTLAFRRKEVEQLVAEVEEEISKTETILTDVIEEQKSQEPKPTETQAQRSDVAASTTESGTQERKEEEKIATEEAQSQPKTEPKQSEEEPPKQKEQEPATEREEQKQTGSESPKKSDEIPIISGL
jgi:flagellar biosynthesis GTPase FlhF